MFINQGRIKFGILKVYFKRIRWNESKTNAKITAQLINDINETENWKFSVDKHYSNLKNFRNSETKI